MLYATTMADFVYFWTAAPVSECCVNGWRQVCKNDFRSWRENFVWLRAGILFHLVGLYTCNAYVTRSEPTPRRFSSQSPTMMREVSARFFISQSFRYTLGAILINTACECRTTLNPDHLWSSAHICNINDCIPGTIFVIEFGITDSHLYYISREITS